jgi:molybdopterin-guanine dinucleotide biosynthesis protein A
VILAGGESRRMGSNKALLELCGEPLVRRQARLAAQVAGEVLVSANDPASGDTLGLPILPDLYPGCGPIAGIHSAMRYSKRPLILVLACDLPRVPVSLLRILVSRMRGHDLAVPRTSDGRFHPLCACYRRELLPNLEARLQTGRYRLTEIVADPALRSVVVTEGFNDLDLVNWNTPKDLLG